MSPAFARRLNTTGYRRLSRAFSRPYRKVGAPSPRGNTKTAEWEGLLLPWGLDRPVRTPPFDRHDKRALDEVA